SAIGTVLFTIVISPPPTRRLDLTSEKSGSTPVVSQSIMKLIVPVGASTVACALRNPCTSPRLRASSHALRHAVSRSVGTMSEFSMLPTAARRFALRSISGVGYDEYPTRISCARNTTSHACSNASTSSSPSSRRNFIRFSDARLHAESSIDMYSEHGLDALIRPVFGSVCQLLIVVSYCTPGSAHSHAAAAIWRSRSRASRVDTTAPSVRAVRLNSVPSVAASMNTSVTRTELFAFWYWIDAQSG